VAYTHCRRPSDTSHLIVCAPLRASRLPLRYEPHAHGSFRIQASTLSASVCTSTASGAADRRGEWFSSSEEVSLSCLAPCALEPARV
jgi:hypothetical protein